MLSSSQFEAFLDFKSDDGQPQVFEIDSRQEQEVPDILETCSVFDSPEHVKWNTVGPESPELNESSDVVVNVILIVSTQREHVIVFVDSGWICLVSFGPGIIVPVSVLTITFSEALQKDHKGKRSDEHEVVDRPDMAGFKQQVMSLLQAVDC